MILSNKVLVYRPSLSSYGVYCLATQGRLFLAMHKMLNDGLKVCFNNYFSGSYLY